MQQVLIPLDATPAMPAPGSELLHLQGHSMGTSWSARLLLPPAWQQRRAAAAPAAMAAEKAEAGLPGSGTGNHARQLLQQGLQSGLDHIEQQMSHWRADSALSRFNRAPAASWQPLPPELAQVVTYGLRVRELSGGAFDPCAGALVRLWGFGASKRYDQPGFRVPDQARVTALASGLRAIRPQWDDAGAQLYQCGTIELDLSAIAKGFALDYLARWLREHDLHHFLLELGGELRGEGVKADGQPWWVQLEPVPGCAPVDETLIALHGLAVATSGDYRQYFRHQEHHLAHTLDPRTGFPLRHRLAAVTVVHSECMVADAFSTALGVLGPEAGLALADQQQLAARFLLRQGAQLHAVHSARWREMLQ